MKLITKKENALFGKENKMRKEIIVCEQCKKEMELGGFGRYTWIEVSIPDSGSFSIGHYDFCCVACLMNFLNEKFVSHQ
jgi:hypothetical protein